MLRNDQNRTHGWDVELTCSQCGTGALPRYEGWSPSLSGYTNVNIQVFAKVACTKCGKRLTGEAGRKLADLFDNLEITAENRNIITGFITRLFLVPAVLAFVLFLGAQMDWWGWGLGTVWILLISALAIPVFVFWKNSQIAGLPTRCECGKPHYIFMGTLENNHCYRCFSCGKLLKVRE